VPYVVPLREKNYSSFEDYGWAVMELNDFFSSKFFTTGQLFLLKYF
jgi:hypothetical protein